MQRFYKPPGAGLALYRSGHLHGMDGRSCGHRCRPLVGRRGAVALGLIEHTIPTSSSFLLFLWSVRKRTRPCMLLSTQANKDSGSPQYFPVKVIPSQKSIACPTRLPKTWHKWLAYMDAVGDHPAPEAPGKGLVCLGLPATIWMRRHSPRKVIERLPRLTIRYAKLLAR